MPAVKRISKKYSAFTAIKDGSSTVRPALFFLTG